MTTYNHPQGPAHTQAPLPLPATLGALTADPEGSLSGQVSDCLGFVCFLNHRRLAVAVSSSSSLF